MDKPYLRDQILKHRSILHKLFEQNKVSKVLGSASDEGLNFVLKLLHLITNGRITLPKGSDHAILKSLRAKKLAAFESRKFLHRLLHGSREDKLTTLRQFSKLYSILFHSIFNES